MYLRSVCRRLLRCPQLAALAPCQNANFCDQQPKSTSKLSDEKSAYSSLLDSLNQQEEIITEATEKNANQLSESSSTVKNSKTKRAMVNEVMRKKAEMFLANLDEDGLKRMEDIKKSIEIMRAENRRVPDELSPYHWKVLLTEHHTFSSRSKYLAKVCIDEWRKKSERMRKELKQKEKQETQERKEEERTSDYPVWSIHKHERKVIERQWGRLRALKSDIDIVFDLDFEQKHREMVNAADQLQRCWSVNINHLQPLNMHFTSVHQNEKLHDILQCAPLAPVNFYQENVFEVFPNKEDLVYLTPDGPQLKEFDPKSTYIIGGIVDLSGRTRLAYGKAKAHGIRTASFPLSKYCNFSDTNRARYILTLDLVMGIMLDMYLHQSWMVALRNNLNKRYVFWEDMESKDFVNARKKVKDKMALRRFEKQKNIMQGRHK